MLLLVVLALPLALGLAAFLLAFVVRVLVAGGGAVISASANAALMFPFAQLVVALAGLEPVALVVPGSAGVFLVVGRWPFFAALLSALLLLGGAPSL